MKPPEDFEGLDPFERSIAEEDIDLPEDAPKPAPPPADPPKEP